MEELEREVIKLTNEAWNSVVFEGYLEDNEGNEIEYTEIERNYVDTKRHTEVHELIFKRTSDNKYFRVNYETSVKDSMSGWEECNYGTTKAIEVFPKEITKIIYV
jgi:hypothetical protein